MTSMFSWQNSVSLCPASFLRHRRYSRYLLTSTFTSQSPMMKRTSFFGCQFQKVLQVFKELFNFSFFSITGWGIDLDYCDIEWFILEMNRDHSVVFEIAPNTAFWTLLLTMRATLFLVKDYCPQQQIKWSSELNSPIPVHFSSLIPKMSTFILTISCLTISNLP